MEMGLIDWGIIAGIIIFSYILSFIFRKILARAIRKRSADMNVDPTKFVFLKNSVSLIIFTIALIIIFLYVAPLKELGKGLFASAGILAATIGLASQKAFSNIFSGIFILMFKPFSVRDTVELKNDNLKGVIEEITLRHTIIRDYENRRIIIPNSLISETTLVNSSIVDTSIRKHIDIGISYDSDVDLAKKIIEEEIIKHPKYFNNLTSDEELHKNLIIRVVGLGEYDIKIRAYVWAGSNDDSFELMCDILESVKKRFDKEGVEIPFPYRTIVHKKDLHPNSKLAENDK